MEPVVIWCIIKYITEPGDPKPAFMSSEHSIHCAFRTLDEAKKFIVENCDPIQTDGMSGLKQDIYYEIEETMLN